MTRTRTAIAAALIAIPAALTACSAPAHTTAHSAACTSPSAPSGTTVSVDSQGNASAPYTGGVGLKCTDGSWVRIH